MRRGKLWKGVRCMGAKQELSRPQMGYSLGVRGNSAEVTARGETRSIPSLKDSPAVRVVLVGIC